MLQTIHLAGHPWASQWPPGPGWGHLRLLHRLHAPVLGPELQGAHSAGGHNPAQVPWGKVPTPSSAQGGASTHGLSANQARLPKGGDPELSFTGRRRKQPGQVHSGGEKVRTLEVGQLCTRCWPGLGPCPQEVRPLLLCGRQGSLALGSHPGQHPPPLLSASSRQAKLLTSLLSFSKNSQAPQESMVARSSWGKERRKKGPGAVLGPASPGSQAEPRGPSLLPIALALH